MPKNKEELINLPKWRQFLGVVRVIINKPHLSRLAWVVGLLLILGQALGQNPRVQIPFELHDKSLRLTEWARQPMLLNPVALSFDYQGRLFVVETARRGTVDIDIRGHKEWVIDDLSNLFRSSVKCFARKWLRN